MFALPVFRQIGGAFVFCSPLTLQPYWEQHSGMSDKQAKAAPSKRTPPEWAKHHSLEPPDAAGVRSTGGWTLHDEVTEAAYAAALKRWQGGSSHG